MITLTYPIDQQSPEWFAAKAGKPSASSFDKILTTKGEPSKQAKKYMHQLAGEAITGIREEGFTNANMERGIELEKEAREFYELINDCKVEQVAICYPDEQKNFLCSPDGLVGKDGMIEIKCPIISTHVGYLLDGTLPLDYFQQTQGQLLVTGRKWVDFISYYPGLKPLVIRVERNESFIGNLEVELVKFCKELKTITNTIR